MAHVIHEEAASSASTQFTSSPLPRSGDHERLFQLLEEAGPAPAEFMLHLSDPVIEHENIFGDEDPS
jgi:hypothetical protein